MGLGIMYSSMSGMLTAQINMQTTGHNIANQGTAGYNRQKAIQATNVPMGTGAGFIGQGVHVTTVRRTYDQFLYSEINRSQATFSELDAYYSKISQIDDIVADPAAGLSPALQAFFNGVQQTAAYPAQLPARQTMVSSAQSLMSRYKALESELSQMQSGVNQQLITNVGLVNSYTKQIAELNETIIVAQGAFQQPPNDLLDQRDQLVAELNKLIKVTTIENTDGSLNLVFGTGQQLVVTNQVIEMTAEPSSTDPTRIAVGLRTGNVSLELPESLLTGGAIGGLLKFRSESLDRAQNEVGRNAASLALTFNAQHALGQDLLGQSLGSTNFARDFFTISGPVVMSNTRNDQTDPAVVTASFLPPAVDGIYTLSFDGANYSLTRQADGTVWEAASLVALQSTLPASAGLDVTNASLAVGGSTQVMGAVSNGSNFYTKLTASDYQLSFDGTDYTVTRVMDGRKWVDSSLANLSTSLASSEGFSITQASGTMVQGDAFLIKPTAAAANSIAVNPAIAGDVRLVAAAMPIRTATEAANTGTGKISAGSVSLGYGAGSVPSTGVSMVYDANTNNLSFTGVPLGENISVTVGNTTTVYPGPDIPYVSGARISFAGVNFEVSGNLRTGDTFKVEGNTGGTSDARNALALSSMQLQNTMAGKTTSYQGAYAQFVSDVGNKTRQLAVTGDAQETLLKQAQSTRDGLSGVNLDEEAANLLRFQHAYQASAKALQVGSSLFDTLLDVLR